MCGLLQLEIQSWISMIHAEQRILLISPGDLHELATRSSRLPEPDILVLSLVRLDELDDDIRPFHRIPGPFEVVQRRLTMSRTDELKLHVHVSRHTAHLDCQHVQSGLRDAVRN